ncbi:OST-HTH/LOTUS domain-containing protein [Desulfomicrobium sp. ZS1]|uniref:OST-HTH/LOTUS domain-containing protein n=1 Tax=Desulfomicrobium sp. ZS1 TaxID=2952228 RepID=UPI0035305E0D
MSVTRFVLRGVCACVRPMKTVGIDFDPRNYGFSKLSELIAAIVFFEIDRREKGLHAKDTRKK